ncbi:FAD-binding protein [Virgibacillus natechei]
MGVKVDKNGESFTINSKAVILASGGFERNQTLREKYHHIGADW